MKIEKIIASSNRCKILLVLRKFNQLSIMNLVRETKSTYNQVNANLKILEKDGLVIERYEGRLRIIRLNNENPKTNSVLKVLKLLDELKREQILKT